MNSYKIYWISSGGWMDKIAEELRKSGHEVGEMSEPDFIIGMTHSRLEEIEKVHNKYPDAKLINYNWDMYSWQRVDNWKTTYKMDEYAKLLSESSEIWCSSQCTAERLKEWYALESSVMLSSVPYYDEETTSGDYVLNALRHLPDRNEGWAETACGELKIPYFRPDHSLSQEAFQKAVANCRFIVNEHYEGSTGGLSLMEAYYLGKPGLISDSPYMGGNEYLSGRVENFKYDDFGDLKRKIKEMWEDTPKVASDHKEFITANYSSHVMAEKINQRLCALTIKKDL